LDLTESNPTRCGLSPSGEEIAGALSRSGSQSYAPDPRGLLSAREAVAAYYRAGGGEVDTENLLLTASTSEAYAYLFKLLCDPGESILIPEPSYPLFDQLTDLEGVARIPYRLVESSGWAPDLADIATGFAAGARAIVLVNPNNPTGSFLKAADHAALSRLAAQHDAAVISDEVFLDYGFREDPERVRVAATGVQDALTFSLGGLSKSCGLPQIKLAWILAGGPPAATGAALQRLELIADVFLSVSTPAQLALPDLFRFGSAARERIRERLGRNLATLDAALARLPSEAGISRLPFEGGWSAVLRLPSTRSEEEIALALLDDCDVLVHPGWFFNFPFEVALVLSLLPLPEIFEEAVERLGRNLAR
jgi:aspartate/methionine/tyrosine aminotransferase